MSGRARVASRPVSATWIRCDSADLRERWDAVYRATMPGEDRIPERHVRWLATVDGEDAAICSAVIVDDGRGCYLSAAGVLPAFRGRRLQRSAVRLRERWARREGVRVCVTYTSPDNHHSMRTLARCGYLPYAPAYAWVGRRRWIYWRRELAGGT